jgi:glycolate oxidase iron-sulfur subunit
METHLADFIANTTAGQEADKILRKCVHCGFCTATCPTYQLLGDELDGPRGRIYLMKQVLEGAEVTASTRGHLDRCLTCRSCESTCPSGVQYGRLADIGRAVIEERCVTPRPLEQRVLRSGIRFLTTRRWLFDPLMRVGQSVRPLLPLSLKSKVPRMRASGTWPRARHQERMLMLEGCVQPAMIPNINKATARVLDAAGISLIRPASAGCCGAIDQHLAAPLDAKQRMRHNIDSWIPYLEDGVTTLVVNASGCTAMVAEYGHIFADDAEYADAAKRVSAACRDLSQVVEAALPKLLPKLRKINGRPVGFHPPCTLQHGLQIRGVVESVLSAAGFEVRLPRDSHLCCGSAGTYSILQSDIALRLRSDKLAKLDEAGGDAVVSANIGCITHLQAGTDKPVRHWIEVIDELLLAR